MRQLAAILFTDMEGFTALMARDEALARQLRDRHREVLRATHEKYRGEILQYFGDGTLSIFSSAVEAARCAIEMQQELQRAPVVPMRIGLHFGEVVKDEEGLFGNSVNIASRIESMAMPGSILLSARLQEELSNQPGLECVSLGLFELKNLDKPMELFALQKDGIVIPKPGQLEGKGKILRSKTTVSKPRLQNFVGREKELEILRNAWLKALNGRGIMMGISGEPGIGKTTLVEDFLLEIKEGMDTSIIARGNCSERLAGTEAYLPFLEILEEITRNDNIDSLLRQFAPSWYVQLRPYSIEESKTLEIATQATQERRKRELANFLSELTKQKPLVLFIDDLHWADASSTDLIAYLASRWFSLPLLVITTFRPSDLKLAKHPFLQLQPEMRAKKQYREITIPFLSKEDISTYIKFKYPGNAFPQELPQRIYERTEGNPLFMADLIEDLEDNEFILLSNAQWTFKSNKELEKTIPDTVLAMVSRKINQLSDADQKILEYAAVQGYQFSSSVIGELLNYSFVEMEMHLNLLSTEHRIVQALDEQEYPDGSISMHYRFVHALYQNHLYEQLNPAEERMISQAVANKLAVHYGENNSTVANELANLYERSRDYKTAAKYYSAAALQSMQKLAPFEAILLSRKGLDLLGKLDETPDTHRLEYELTLSLSSAISITKGYGFPELTGLYHRALQLFNQLPKTIDLALSLLAIWHHFVVKAAYQKSFELIEKIQFISIDLNNKDLEILAQYCLGLTYFCTGEFEKTIPLRDVVIPQYKPEQHKFLAYRYGLDLQVSSGSILAWTLVMLGYPDQARQYVELAMQHAKELGLPSLICYASVYYLHRLCLLREFDEAGQLPEEVFSMASAEGIVLWKNEVQLVSIICQSHHSADQKLIEEFEEIDRIHRTRTGTMVGYSYYRYQLANVCFNASELPKALEALNEALEFAKENQDNLIRPDIFRLKGDIVLLSDQNEYEAERLFQQAIATAKKQHAKWLELRAAHSLAKLWQSQGKKKLAYDLLENVYKWFTEGFDTPDLKEAKALLGELKDQLNTEQRPPSIAILPFVNMSSDPEQEYFCDGVTEEILNALAQVKDLKVIARTSSFSFKGKNEDIREISKQLGVDHILEGSVRKAGNQLRITAQLIKAEDGSHLWSERFDRELKEVFAIQDEIAISVAKNLKIKLLSSSKINQNTPQHQSLEAYNLYLKGKYFWNRWSSDEDFSKSIFYFEKSLAIEENNAKVWSGLSLAYNEIGLGYWNYRPAVALPKAKNAALKALELDPFLSEAHSSLGFLGFWYEYNWEIAEKSLKYALELDPNSSYGYDRYGTFLSALGRAEEAIDHHSKAGDLDPLSVLVQANMALALYRAREYDKALSKWRQMREMYPVNPMVPCMMSLTDIKMGNPDAAVNHIDESIRLSGGLTTYRILKPYIYANAGRMEIAVKEMKQLELLKDKEHLWMTGMAISYSAIGEFDKALSTLEKAIEELIGWSVYIGVEPCFDPMRNEERFKKMISKLNL